MKFDVALRSAKGRERRAALEALWSAAPGELRAFLAEERGLMGHLLLRDGTLEVRRLAARFFGVFGPWLTDAEAALNTALERQVRLGPKRDEELTHALLTSCSVLPARGEHSAELALHLLGDRSVELRAQAAFVLGIIGRGTAIEPLRDSALLEYEISGPVMRADLVSRQAFLSLGRIHPRLALETLSEHLIELARRHREASYNFTPYFAIFTFIAAHTAHTYSDAWETLERRFSGSEEVAFARADLARMESIRKAAGTLRALDADGIRARVTSGLPLDRAQLAAELGHRAAARATGHASGFKGDVAAMIMNLMQRDREVALRTGLALCRLVLPAWEMQYADDYPPREVILAVEDLLRGEPARDADLTGCPPSQWCTPRTFAAVHAINTFGAMTRDDSFEPERIHAFVDYLLRALVGGPGEIPVTTRIGERSLRMQVPVFGGGGLRIYTAREALRRIRRTLHEELSLWALDSYDPVTKTQSG